MSFSITALIGQPTVVELSALQDQVTKQYPTNATVTLDLYDPITGAVVPNANAIALTWDNTTSGVGTIYRGVLPPTAALTPNVYPAKVHVVVGGTPVDMYGTCTARRG